MYARGDNTGGTEILRVFGPSRQFGKRILGTLAMAVPDEQFARLSIVAVSRAVIPCGGKNIVRYVIGAIILIEFGTAGFGDIGGKFNETILFGSEEFCQVFGCSAFSLRGGFFRVFCRAG